MRLTLACFLIGLFAACGGGSGDDTSGVDAADFGFNKPAGILRANANDAEVGDADLTSCAADAATPGPVILTTEVVDFQGRDSQGGCVPIPGATVVAFPDINVDAP